MKYFYFKQKKRCQKIGISYFIIWNSELFVFKVFCYIVSGSCSRESAIVSIANVL